MAVASKPWKSGAGRHRSWTKEQQALSHAMVDHGSWTKEKKREK